MLIRNLISRSPHRSLVQFTLNQRLFVTSRWLQCAKQDDKPISYTQSKAYKYKAAESFRVVDDGKQSYSEHTSLVLKISLGIFLIYFGILRESNDIDEMLSRDLFEVMPDLEIPMLEADILRLEKQGVDTTELRKKLKEVKLLHESKKN